MILGVILCLTECSPRTMRAPLTDVNVNLYTGIGIAVVRRDFAVDGPSRFVVQSFAERYGSAPGAAGVPRTGAREPHRGAHRLQPRLRHAGGARSGLLRGRRSGRRRDGSASSRRTWSRAREWATGEIAQAQPARDWGDYVMGVARELVLAGYEVPPSNLLISSTVPVGSGLSSSAAIEVSVAKALLGRPSHGAARSGQALPARGEQLRRACPAASWTSTSPSSAGRRPRSRSIAAAWKTRSCRLPEQAEFVAVNTMVKHELGSSAYRHRVAECAAAVAVIREKIPQVESLRDVSSEMLAGFAGVMAPVPMQRARHVVSEDERVEAFVAASRAGDLKKMGELLVASHRSLQKDYEVSCEELDFLVDTALGLPGVYGARMTGGGFGGCTVNMVRPDAALKFQAAISHAYQARFGLTPGDLPLPAFRWSRRSHRCLTNGAQASVRWVLRGSRIQV